MIFGITINYGLVIMLTMLGIIIRLAKSHDKDLKDYGDSPHFHPKDKAMADLLSISDDKNDVVKSFFPRGPRPGGH